MGAGETIARAFGAEDAAPFLLPGEQQLEVIAANALVAEQDTLAWIRARHQARFLGQSYGMVAGALDAVAHSEASGGLLSLTNYRLLFVAHHANLHTGHFSVFLPTIEAAQREETGMTEQLAVLTPTMAYLFKVGDSPAAVEAIGRARASVTTLDLETMKQGAQAYPDRVGQGLHAFWRSDTHPPREDDLLARIRRALRDRRLEEVYGALSLIELLHPEWRARVLDLLGAGS